MIPISIVVYPLRVTPKNKKKSPILSKVESKNPPNYVGP